MEDGFRIQNSKVAIIGLGLMGGSLALALKGKCAALYGIDSDRATLELALSKSIIHKADTDPSKLLPQADLVILATPVPIIVSLIRDLPALIQTPCVVLDLGSTKLEIAQAMFALPAHFDPIGGHPICGKETLGLENADANLYQDAPFVVTPLARTTHLAKSAVAQVISMIGARSIHMDAGEHDGILASTSHLPFLLSSALALSTPQEFASLVGSGFRSTSRLAGTPSHMTVGILQSNRDNILHAIQAFRSSLDQMESSLRDENYVQLESILNQSRAAYQSLISGP